MQDKNKMGNCPCCGHVINLTQKSLLDSKILSVLEKVSEIEHDRTKELEYVGKILDEIKARIYGNTIGFVQETVVISELKTGCPYDRFSEEMSSKHGTDVVAYVREGGIEIGKISISVKRQKKWNSVFIHQLENNIRDDQSNWGLLVTTVFPNEALNDNVWTTFDSCGRLILMVKPSFAAVAYYAIRQIVIYEYLLNNALLEKSVVKRSTNLNLIHLQKNQKISQDLRGGK